MPRRSAGENLQSSALSDCFCDTFLQATSHNSQSWELLRIAVALITCLLTVLGIMADTDCVGLHFFLRLRQPFLKLNSTEGFFSLRYLLLVVSQLNEQPGCTKAAAWIG